MLQIDINTLILGCVCAGVIVFIALCISYLVRYYTKRKYNSVDAFYKAIADKSTSYDENKTRFTNDLVSAGIQKKKDHNLFKVAIDFIKYKLTKK